jgi:hypothetical protein
MSIEIEKLSDAAMESVSGGMTANLKAAYACINGDFGNGQDRINNLRNAGFDPTVVQGLVNDLLQYESVAKDVIDGKYGNGTDRINNLRKAGYPYEVIQNLVNNMLL